MKLGTMPISVHIVISYRSGSTNCQLLLYIPEHICFEVTALGEGCIDRSPDGIENFIINLLQTYISGRKLWRNHTTNITRVYSTCR